MLLTHGRAFYQAWHTQCWLPSLWFYILVACSTICLPQQNYLGLGKLHRFEICLGQTTPQVDYMIDENDPRSIKNWV
jgi:hypothetical protein